MRTGFLAFVAAMIGAAFACGQMKAVIPPGAEYLAGGSSNSIPIGNFASGTYQVMYAAELLSAIPPGSTITGMELRLNNAAASAYPTTLRSLLKYDVRLASTTRTPATMSGTYATNMSNAVLVRSGATSISADAYPAGNSGSVPEGWGAIVPFSTPYLYNGGGLVVEIRTETAATPTAHFADMFAVLGKMAWSAAGSSTAATGSTPIVDVGLVIRLTYTPPAWELAHGVTKVIVTENAAMGSTLGGQPLVISNTEKTQLMVARADHFDTLAPGSRIVGMTWRNRTTEAWPAAAARYSNFSVEMARSLNAPETLSTTINSNFAPGSWQTTRTGPLSIPANSFGSQPTFFPPALFGFEVAFSNPFEYSYGPLAWVLRHSGQPQAEGLLDALPTDGPFYGTTVRSYSANSMNATVASTPAFAEVTRFSIDAGAGSPLGQEGPGADLVGGDLYPVLQWIIAGSELVHIPPGSVIDSLWLRQNIFAGAAPETDITAADLEVSLSTAARRPGTMSQTFAINDGADKVLVHDGPATIGAGSLPGGSDGRFGRLVQFRKNFVYKGGDVCVTVRHTGLSGDIGTLEGLFGTEGFNRCVFSNASGSSTGNYFFSGYSGMALRLGYIPSVMTPNALTTSNGAGGWTTPQQSAYTIQVIIAADQLRTVGLGSLINGMSLRQGSATNLVSFPATATTLPRFDVKLSTTPNTPLTMSDTFASNIGSVSRDVRTGPITVPAGAFTSSGSSLQKSENYWYVPFDRGYVYRGGDMCVTIRAEGVLAPSGYFEGLGSTPIAAGASRYLYGDADATIGLSWGPPAIRLAFTARAFCPADLNNDGQVDDADFVLFVAAYDVLDCADGSMVFGCPADFNYDRLVDDADFVAFVAAYNELLCP